MARYLETAAEANKTAKELFQLVIDKPEFSQANGVPGGMGEGDSHQTYESRVAELIARLVNYGMRCCPRPAQSTVRLNAVKRSVAGLPVKVTMEKRTDDRTGKEYNALVTTPQ